MLRKADGVLKTEKRKGSRKLGLRVEGSRGVGSVAEVKWSGGSIARVAEAEVEVKKWFGRHNKCLKGKRKCGWKKNLKLERPKSEASIPSS